jgi:hypothetical protein
LVAPWIVKASRARFELRVLDGPAPPYVHVRADPGRQVSESDFTFINSDRTKSTGTGISGFDSKTNRFTTVWYDSRQTTMSIRQSDGTFDGKNIVLWATPLDTEHPGHKTVARAHLEDNGHVLLHRHFLIDDKGEERMIIELRMTRK